MDTTQLKSYAPEARKAFEAAVIGRAARFGITAASIECCRVDGNVLLVGDRMFPANLAESREALVSRIEACGYEATMEAIAYTWFNRFVAIRYMELHSYLGHGYRVLSHPKGLARPEILDHASEVCLPELDRARVAELILDGANDEALYRRLLLAQCSALNVAMPLLFDAVGCESELLLPDGLLLEDSLVRRLVEAIDEHAWQRVEIIGWLYQFYTSEKKGQVLGKQVKSEDIPAATQIFTPNWIVKYMVQNSLGDQWLRTYPESPLRERMEYHVDPVKQSDDVKAQLAAITPRSLDPYKLTLIDPACGAGHILVEAYDVFRAIHLECGARREDIARFILEGNLFGLDIDARAAQLTGFALMMKGRADDRRLFERGVELNVAALVDSTDFDAEGLAEALDLTDYGLDPTDLSELKQLFEQAAVFGSLIGVPQTLAARLPRLKKLSEATVPEPEVRDALLRLRTLVHQATLLSDQYDDVVANPPYLGLKNQARVLKQFLREYYAGYDKDLFSAFVARGLSLLKNGGRLGYMTPIVWMFLSTHEELRAELIKRQIILSLVQLEDSSFQGATVPICTFALWNVVDPGYRGVYVRLSEFRGWQAQAPKTLEALNDRNCSWRLVAEQGDFSAVPGSPVSYWATKAFRRAFARGVSFEKIATPRQGLGTGDNNRFTRQWYEVAYRSICFDAEDAAEARNSRKKWFPYNKGGGYRKWFGNNASVVNWERDGAEIRQALVGKNPNIPRSEREYFRKGITWGLISGASFSARATPAGAIFDVGGSKAFPNECDYFLCLGLLNSKLVVAFMAVINPTVNSQVGDLKKIPVLPLGSRQVAVSEGVRAIVDIARSDWNALEAAWGFEQLPLLTASSAAAPTLASSYAAWVSQNRQTVVEVRRLEEENNRLFIEAYGLEKELSRDVPIERVTLSVNPAYRYGGKFSVGDQWTRFRRDSMEELVSYAIGCMMGRYSLDEPGLIYAYGGNDAFDPSRYTRFPASGHGIVPLSDIGYFEDDACRRLIEFISVAWDRAHLEANLEFLASNLSPNKGESSRATIRRYLCDKFFKNHLQTYKKRPIYWLYSSGKHKAFQGLVYLHRYNDGTLGHMRSDYVVPLQSKMAARMEMLKQDSGAAESMGQRRILEKQRAKLEKQQMELLTFEEKLRHFADKRIALDLDDGVKANYGKFGDLLANVEVVRGKVAEVA